MPDLHIAITANFTAESLQDPLLFLFGQLNMPVKLEFAPYNQVFQQLLDPASLCRQNRGGINVVLLRLEEWGKPEVSESGKVVFPPNACDIVARAAEDFVSALRAMVLKSDALQLVVICPPSLAAASEPPFSAFLREMEQFIDSTLEEIKGVHVVLPNLIAETYPVPNYDDPEGNRLGHIPYSESFFIALAATIVRRIFRLRNAPYKVIALDCDQTLWRGICGEDGPHGVEIDPPRRVLQELIVNQYKVGMLICLCSRNNERDVFEVFEQRPEMPLKRDHILSSRINWRPKSENLRSLSSQLNLGLDSFIFIDDDPAVCAEVRANCPEVLTLQLPSEAEEIVSFLKHIWAFDDLGITSEDESRTSLYRVNEERERLRSDSGSLEDFLAGLCLEVTISSLCPEHPPRVSQLTQRTNQFNFTTIRRSELEIEQLYRTGQVECLTVNVSDRFGDYGLVGVMIFRTQQNALEVDTFLLSCRALGRGVEHRMLAQLGSIASDRKLEHVDIRYLATEKNRPAYEFISQLDATETKTTDGDAIFRISLQVAVAAKVGFVPLTALDSAGENAEIKEPLTPDLNGNALRISSLLARVQTELSTPQLILSALTEEKARLRMPGTVLVAPRNEAETSLKLIWEHALGVQPIGVLENYFSLGGDSFQAVRIFSEIERTFGRHLPLVTLLEAPTIRQLADLLRENTEQRTWSSLVPIQPLGSRPPFFCMHAAGGNVLFYRDLAKHLGMDQPFFGLQARGVNREQTNHNSVEEMAACYIGEIRTFQPRGPYYLGGSSFGGLVAFEMARQLEHEGERVAVLALFDTYGPGYPRLATTSKTPGIAKRWVELVSRVRETLTLLEPKERLEYILAKAVKVRKKLVRKFMWKRNEIAIAFNSATGRPLPKDIQRNHKAIDQALRTYEPQTYGGRLTLFRAATQPGGVVPDDTLGWAGMALGGLEIYEVPGFHGAVTVDPHARFLAERLTPCLLSVQQSYQEILPKGVVTLHAKSVDRGSRVEETAAV